jgi:hypothetical protein
MVDDCGGLFLRGGSCSGWRIICLVIIARILERLGRRGLDTSRRFLKEKGNFYQIIVCSEVKIKRTSASVTV